MSPSAQADSGSAVFDNINRPKAGKSGGCRPGPAVDQRVKSAIGMNKKLIPIQERFDAK